MDIKDKSNLIILGVYIPREYSSALDELAAARKDLNGMKSNYVRWLLRQHLRSRGYDVPRCVTTHALDWMKHDKLRARLKHETLIKRKKRARDNEQKKLYRARLRERGITEGQYRELRKAARAEWRWFDESGEVWMRSGHLVQGRVVGWVSERGEWNQQGPVSAQALEYAIQAAVRDGQEFGDRFLMFLEARREWRRQLKET